MPAMSPRRHEPEGSERIPTLREPRYSQSLERGLGILGCFTPRRALLGLAEIVDELGMSRSTTHRYMVTLVALGFLEQDASRKYRLGLRVTDLGMSVLNSTGLREPSRPYLQELRQRTCPCSTALRSCMSNVLGASGAASTGSTSTCAPARACPPIAPRWARSY